MVLFMQISRCCLIAALVIGIFPPGATAAETRGDVALKKGERIIFLGDSITAGDHILDNRIVRPNQLFFKRLRQGLSFRILRSGSSKGGSDSWMVRQTTSSFTA